MDNTPGHHSPLAIPASRRTPPPPLPPPQLIKELLPLGRRPVSTLPPISPFEGWVSWEEGFSVNSKEDKQPQANLPAQYPPSPRTPTESLVISTNERLSFRRGSPASSVGSAISEISVPPRSRKRQRTISRVDSEELLKAIRTWDDGQGQEVISSGRSSPYAPSSPPEFPAHLTTLNESTTKSQKNFSCSHPGCTAAPFQTQHLLNSHYNIHTKDSIFFCPVEGCPRTAGQEGFKRRSDMLIHRMLEHKRPSYFCPYCADERVEYFRASKLMRHARICHPEKKDDPGLHMILAELSSTSNYLACENQEVETSVKCDHPTCSWVGKCPSDKRKHETRHRKLFKCDEPNCPRKEGFGTIDDLAHHKKCVHNKEPDQASKTLYICFGNNCPRPNKKWSRLDIFKGHLNRMHFDEDAEDLCNRSIEWYKSITGHCSNTEAASSGGEQSKEL